MESRIVLQRSNRMGKIESKVVEILEDILERVESFGEVVLLLGSIYVVIYFVGYAIRGCF